MSQILIVQSSSSDKIASGLASRLRARGHTAEVASEWATGGAIDALVIREVDFKRSEGWTAFHEAWDRSGNSPPAVVLIDDRARGYIQVRSPVSQACHRVAPALGDIVEAVNVALIERDAPKQLYGSSAPMQRVFAEIERFAPTREAVLILGETGTGKEVAARMLHDLSDRQDAPLVTASCPSFTSNLADSELFGHVRGGYTGAFGDRTGFIRTADCATLFLDELGDLPLETQAKLLRTLQSGDASPVGSDQTYHVDVRFLAATNRNLEAEVAKGHFREDLLHRFTFRVTLPPLRERPEDIPGLIERLLPDIERGTKKRPAFTQGAIEWMMEQDWPGNVRDLQSVLKNAATIYQSKPIDREQLQQLSSSSTSARTPSRVATPASAQSDAAGADVLLQMEKPGRDASAVDNLERQLADSLGVATEALKPAQLVPLYNWLHADTKKSISDKRRRALDKLLLCVLDRSIARIEGDMGAGTLANYLERLGIATDKNKIYRAREACGLSGASSRGTAPQPSESSDHGSDGSSPSITPDTEQFWRTQFDTLLRQNRRSEFLNFRAQMYATLGAPNGTQLSFALHDLLSREILQLGSGATEAALLEARWALELAPEQLAIPMRYRLVLALLERATALQGRGLHSEAKPLLKEAYDAIQAVLSKVPILADDPEWAGLRGRYHRTLFEEAAARGTADPKYANDAYLAYKSAYAKTKGHYPGGQAVVMWLLANDKALVGADGDVRSIAGEVTRQCELAAETTPSFWAYCSLAEMYLAEGREEDARRVYQQARGPSSSLRFEAPTLRELDSASKGLHRAARAGKLSEARSRALEEVLRRGGHDMNQPVDSKPGAR